MTNTCSPAQTHNEITINPLNNMGNKNNKILKNSDNLGQNIRRHLLPPTSNVVFVHSKPEKKLLEAKL